MRGFFRAAVALAAVTMFAPASGRAQAKPVIAVMYFDNNSFGKDRADYDGLGKGVADMLITDMASNPNIRVVERERVQALLTEQNLTKTGAVDNQTAIRLGKLIGAQYMITGAFMSDGKGSLVLTARAISMETSEISNPVRLDSKGDDVLGLIAQLSAKLKTDMKLPALRVGENPSAGAVPAGQPAHAAPADVAAAPKAAEAKPAEAKAAKPAAKPATQVAQAPTRKMDVRTALLYAKALDESDAGNNSKAVELFRQVLDKFPEYAPAQAGLKRVSRS